MTYRDIEELRVALQRHHRVDLTNSEWATLVKASGLNIHAALGAGDFDAASLAFQKCPAFAKALQDDIARAREVLALSDGPKIVVDAHFAIRALEAIEDGRQLVAAHGPQLALNAEGVGKLLLTLAAAQRIAERRKAEINRVVYALLAGPDNVPFEPPAEQSFGRQFLADFSANSVATANQFAFGDLRKTRASRDLALVVAVATICRPERLAAQREKDAAKREEIAATYNAERRTTAGASPSVRKASTATRWGARLDVYEADYAATVGRSFKDAQKPWRAFQQAFKQARERILKTLDSGWPMAGTWPAIEDIE